MPNIATYLGNVSKSIIYSAVDQVKALNPAISEMVEQNAELTKQAYEAAKDYKGSIKKASDFIIKSDVGEAAIQMKKSIWEDLKSGQFYNRKRIDEMDMRASGGLLDFDMDDDPFAEIDSDWDVNGGDFDLSDPWDDIGTDDKYLAESMDATGEKIVKGVAEVSIRTADYIVGANTKNAAMMQKHNELMTNKIGGFISAANSSILRLVEFNETNMITHINNSQKFYDFTTNNLTKQVELLQNISDNITKMNGSYSVEKKSSSDRIKYEDIVGAEGMPDLAQYFKMVAANINDLTGGLAELNKSMGGNMLMTLAGSPLKFITDGLVKTVIPKSIETVTKSLNESLSGTFASLMLKAEHIANTSDNEFFRKVAEVLGTNTGLSTSVDVSKYNRGAIPFDGETKTAILNISQQMSKVISLMSGQSERVFDYNTGKWTTFDKINSEYGTDKFIKRASDSASSELRDMIKEMTSRTDFGTAERKKQFETSVDNMFLEAFKSGGLQGFNKDPYEFARRMGIDHDDIRFIIPLLNQIKKTNRSKLIKYNANILDQRSRHNRNMKSLESSPSDVMRLLYNNYNGDEFVNKKTTNGKTSLITNPYDIDIKNNKSPLMGNNLIVTRDNKGKNIFDYLQKTIWELEYIRKNGLPGNETNSSGKGKRGRRSQGHNRQPIMPTPFENRTYMDSHKTHDEQVLSDNNKAEDRYYRERERMYEKEWNEKEKGDYTGEIFTASERFDNLDGDDESVYINEYTKYLDSRADMKAIDELRKQNNKKRAKKEKRPGWIKAFFEMDAVDDRVSQFMTGVFDLSQKPAEFLSRMVERTDKALFEAIYGGEDEDGLTTRSFMGQLISRMTATFANFGDFLKDNILSPLKEELFGNDGIRGATKKITDILKDKLNINTEDIMGSIKEFVMGSYYIDDHGNRQRTKAGMFGSKIDYIKNNMKDVYRTPIQMLQGDVIRREHESEEDARQRVSDFRDLNKEIAQRNRQGEDRAVHSPFRFVDEKYVDEDGNIDLRVFSTRKEVMNEIAQKIANGEEVPNYYNGSKYVNKTGIAAVSEGEMIIPAELNPFYNKAVNKLDQKRKENAARRDFASYINGLGKSNKIDMYDIPAYADGTGAAEVYPINMSTGRENRTQASHKTSGSSDDAAAASGHVDWYNPNGASYEVNKEERIDIRSMYHEGKEAIGYRIGDEVKNLFGFFGALGINKRNITERLSNASETFARSAERIANQMAEAVGDGQDSQKLYNDMVKDVKGGASKYLPSMLGGGLLGAGVSLVTGAIGGPLLGAAIGAATDLTVSSGAVQNWLFGEIGSDGKRRGNILSKDLSNNITKYFPDMAKGAVVGGITSILPFVPGGPVAGIMVGSAIGFAKNNDKINKFLFGDEETEGLISKRAQQTFKEGIPAGILGGAIGAFAGPFGLIGNILAGSAIGFASKTETFQNFLFGKQNEDGEIEGGLVNTIREGFVNPIIDFGGGLIDRFYNWFKRDIAEPITNAIAPITKTSQLLVGKLVGAITGKIGEMMDKELETLKMPMTEWFKEKVVKRAGRIAKGGINALAHPAGRIISSPFRMIGYIGDYNRARHVASGNATYMTAAERLRYREEVSNNVKYERYAKDERDENGVLIHRKGEFVIGEDGEPIVARRRRFGLLNDLSTGRRNRRDKFKDFDNMLVNTSVEDLQSMSEGLSYLRTPNTVAKKQRKTSVNKIRTILAKLPYNIQNDILTRMDNDDFEGAMATVRRLNIEPSEKRNIIQRLTQEFSNYQTSTQLLNDEAGSKQKIMAHLRSLGFKDINVKNMDKYKALIDQEVANKSDEKSEIEKLNENQDNRHTEIVDLFNSAIDEIKALRDPEYAAKLASDRFEQNMYEAQKQRGLFRFMDGGNSGVFGNYTYKAEMGEDNKLHYYRIAPDGTRESVDDKGRPIDSDGRFTERYDALEQYYDNNESAGNTTSRNIALTAQSGLLGVVNRLNNTMNNIGNAISSGVNNAWNGASYEERARNRSAKYQKSQEKWKRKVEEAGLTIPENFNGSYKELWKEHFYGRTNLRREAESDDVKYVSDSNGRPIKWIRNNSGQWEIDNSDTETNNYLSAGERATALLQSTSDKVGDLVGTVKDGFFNLFNIDRERDGWLKTLAKMGAGVLGVLTIAGFGPILENWFENTAVPAIGNFWETKIAPKLGEWLEPVKPTLARAAAGIDASIRSIPFAIENTIDRIKNFFRYDFPDIMTNKIIPFYKNGIEWLGEKTSWIVETALSTLFKVAPHLIKGVIQGTWQFMKNDIFTLFGGYGRRDANSLLRSTSRVSGTTSAPDNNSSSKKYSSLSNFSGFSGLYTSIMGETPNETLGIGTPATAEQLQPYYRGESTTHPPVKLATLNGGNITRNITRNTAPTTGGSSFNSFASPDQYAKYGAGVGYSGTTNIDSGIINEYNKMVSQNTSADYNVGYNNTQSIANWNRTSIEQANLDMADMAGAGFTVDETTGEVFDEQGNGIGYTDGNSFFDYNGQVYDNDSLMSLYDPNNKSIASMGVKSATRAFLTGKGSIFTKRLSKFGKSKFMKRHLLTRSISRPVRVLGNTVEGAGKLGASIHNAAGRMVTGVSYDNLLKSTTSSVADNLIDTEWNRLTAEALEAGFTSDEAVQWAALNIGESSDNIHRAIYSSVDNAANIGFNNRTTAAGMDAVKKGLVSSADDKMAKLATTTSANAADAVLRSTTEAATSSQGILKTITNKIVKFFDDIIANATIKKYMKKALRASGQDATEQAVNAALKTLSKEGKEALIEEFAGSLVKSGSKVLKVAGKVVPFIGIAFYIADFVSGWMNAASIIGILDEDCTMLQRITCGFANLVNGVVTLGLLPLSILVELFVKILAPIFNINIDELLAARDAAAEAVAKYNAEHGTNLDLEQYNKRDNVFVRGWNKVKGFFGGTDIYEGTSAKGTSAKGSAGNTAVALSTNSSSSNSYSAKGSGLSYDFGTTNKTSYNKPLSFEAFNTIPSAKGSSTDSRSIVNNAYNKLSAKGSNLSRLSFTPTKVRAKSLNQLSRRYSAKGNDNAYVDTNEYRSENILNEIISTIMVLESSTSLSSMNFNVDGKDNIAVGIMQWKAADATKIINKIIKKNIQAAKSILAETSTVYTCATQKKNIKGKDISTSGRTNLGVLLASNESKTVQFESAKSLAQELLRKCPLSNYKAIILWSAIYNNDKILADKVLSSSNITNSCTPSELFEELKTMPEFTKNANKYTRAYNYAQLSPCNSLSTRCDFNTIEKVMTKSPEALADEEGNWLTKLFNKISELGQMFFFGSTEKPDTSNMDDSIISSYNELPDEVLQYYQTLGEDTSLSIAEKVAFLPSYYSAQLLKSNVLGKTTAPTNATSSANSLSSANRSVMTNAILSANRSSPTNVITSANRLLSANRSLPTNATSSANRSVMTNAILSANSSLQMNAISTVSNLLRTNRSSSNLNAKGSFVSQYDYGNRTFADGESLAQAGCGPAVASMILGSGKDTTNPVMDYTALYANKYKNSGGTNATYFQDILGNSGYNTNYISSGVKSGIKDSLKSGEQVIIMGNDKSNTSKARSPFGSGNHYVLATGIGNGKVAINDPEQDGPRIYSDRILNSAKLGIGVSAKGTGNRFLGLRKYSAKGNWDANRLLHQDLKMYGANSVTAEQLENFIKSKSPNSFWVGKAKYFIEASRATGLDPRYILAHAIHETGWKVSNIARDKCNFFGIAAFDATPYESAYSFSSVAAGIIEGAKWINRNYYNGTHAQTTLYKMRFNNGQHQYATDPGWATKIANIWAGMPPSIADPQPDHMRYGQEINYDNLGDDTTTNTNETVDDSPTGTWLDRLIKGIEKAGNAYFGISNRSAEADTTTSSATPVNTADYFTNPSAQKLVDYARTFVGRLNYVYGGTNLETGVDCSGFTQEIFKKFGVTTRRTAAEQYQNENALFVDKDSLEKGDLVFFKYSNGNKAADHVGIYSGNNQYIHAPGTGKKVTEATLSKTYLLGGRRFKIGNADHVGIYSGKKVKKVTEATLSKTHLLGGRISKIGNNAAETNAKGSGLNKSRQQLVSTLAAMGTDKVVNNVPRINFNKASLGAKPIGNNVSKLVKSFSDKVNSHSKLSSMSAMGTNSGDSLIYDALNTLIQLQGQIVTNTSISAQYDKEVAELIKLSNQYMDQQTAKGTTVRRDSDNARGTTNNTPKRHIPSGVNNITQQRSASDRQRLAATLNRVKSLLSN